LKTYNTCAENLATTFYKNIFLLCSREHMLHFAPFNAYVSSRACKNLQCFKGSNKPGRFWPV